MIRALAHARTTTQTGLVVHDDLLARLGDVPASDARDAFTRFVSACGEASLRRDGGPEHVTASCFVFSPDLRQTLLCFHAKGRFWVQFGGHIEADDSTIAVAALREAREESGLADLALLSESIVDLDRHDLQGGFTCAAHWDVRFVALASPDAQIEASDESEDVRWFPVDELPGNTANGLAVHLLSARERAAVLAKTRPMRDREGRLFGERPVRDRQISN